MNTRRATITEIEHLGEVKDSQPTECDVFSATEPYPIDERDFTPKTVLICDVPKRDFSKLTAAMMKVAYFQWRDSWTYDEEDGYAQYIEEDRERRLITGITDADETEWRELRAKDAKGEF